MVIWRTQCVVYVAYLSFFPLVPFLQLPSTKDIAYAVADTGKALLSLSHMSEMQETVLSGVAKKGLHYVHRYLGQKYISLI